MLAVVNRQSMDTKGQLSPAVFDWPRETTVGRYFAASYNLCALSGLRASCIFDG